MNFNNNVFRSIILLNLLAISCQCQETTLTGKPFSSTTGSTIYPTTTTTAPATASSWPTRASDPEPVVYPASCRDQNTWYIAGGYKSNASSAALYSLDLSIPWTSSTGLPWTRLPDGPHLSTLNCITSSNSTFQFLDIKGPSLTYFGNEDQKQPFMSVLDIQQGSWTTNATKLLSLTRNDGITPVGNPLDGNIYIRGGYSSPDANTMDIYNPQLDKLTSIPIPQPPAVGMDISTGSTGVPSAKWYGAVWCSKRSSILYFGGRVESWNLYAPRAIYEYVPSNDTWSILPTNGPTPSYREDQCMTIDQTCSKLVIFGGQDLSDFFGDIFILDLETLQFTKGPSTGLRVGMTCTMYDDGFLVWGGAEDPFLVSVYGPNPSVFNLTTLQWTESYKAVDLSQPDDNDSGGKSNTLALSLGLTIGILSLIAATVGLLLYRKEKKKSFNKLNGVYKLRSNGSQNQSPGSNTLASIEDAEHGVNTHELTIPRSANQRHNDSASVQSYTSGKVYDEGQNQESHQSRQRGDQRNERHYDNTNNDNEDTLCHKIEFEPGIVHESELENSKYEDLSFNASLPSSSSGRPTPAPPVPPMVSNPVTNLNNPSAYSPYNPSFMGS